MNKSKKWGIIALVICVIGGIVMFSLNHPNGKIFDNKLTLTKTQQDNVVKRIIKGYDVDSVKFIEFTKDKKTGTYLLNIELRKNGLNKETTIPFRDLQRLDNDTDSLGLNPVSDFKVFQRSQPLAIQDISMNDITINYLGE